MWGGKEKGKGNWNDSARYRNKNERKNWIQVVQCHRVGGIIMIPQLKSNMVLGN